MRRLLRRAAGQASGHKRALSRRPLVRYGHCRKFDPYPDLASKERLYKKVILNEEESFLRAPLTPDSACLPGYDRRMRAEGRTVLRRGRV